MEKILTSKEVANLLGIKPQTLAAWRSRGKGPEYIRVSGRMVLYRESDLIRWLNQHTVKTKTIPNSRGR